MSRLAGALRQLWSRPGRRWLGRGTWAIADQALFAGTNFALNIVLARWLSESGYGAFGVAYTLFLFAGTAHTALLTEPLLVYGPGKYAGRFRAYLAGVLRGHWAFAALLAALSLGGGLLAGPELGPPLLALALAGPLTLFQWLMRRACYALSRPELAAASGFAYFALVAGLLWGLQALEVLSAVTALLATGAASLVSGLWLYTRLKPAAAKELAADIRQDHWVYGRWALGAALLSWFPTNAFYLLLPIWWGLDAVGGYRALLNLQLPAMNVTTALGTVLLPALVRRKEGRGFARTLLVLAGAFALVPLAYGLLVAIFGLPLLELLYAGRYTDYVDGLWLAGFIPALAGIVAVTGGALRALERPRALFITYACAAALTLTLGTFLVRSSGVTGALWGWLAAYVLTTLLTGGFVMRLLGKRP